VRGCEVFLWEDRDVIQVVSLMILVCLQS
jgi:hypothetical protein